MPNWDAEEYHKSSSQQQKWALELLTKLELKGNERVLDVGCGDGKITAVISQHVPHGSVLGVDNSESMVAFAKKNFPQATFPNLSFQLCDAAALPYKNEFDALVSFSALHWVHDHASALRGMYSSLKPHGKTLLSFGGKGNAEGVEDAAQKIISQKKWRGYFKKFVFPWKFYGVAEYRTFLRAAGFHEKHLALVPKDMVHQGKEGFKSWLRTTHSLPYAEKLPQDLRENFIEDAANAYVRQFPEDKEGFVHVKMVRLEVEAVKKA